MNLVNFKKIYSKMKKLFLLFTLMINSLVFIGQSINSELIIDPNSKISIGNDNSLKLDDSTYLVRYFDKLRYLSYENINNEVIKIKIKSYYDDTKELITDYNNIIDSLLDESPLYWEISDEVCIIYSSCYEILVTRNDLHTEIIFIDLVNEQHELLNMK